MHQARPTGPAPIRLAISATLHCLTGCAIGEVLGMVIGTALGWSDVQTIVLAVALAFVFGYSFTIGPVMRSGLPLRAAIPVALAADTVSITVMEIVDNAVMLLVPGAMDAGLASWLFWLPRVRARRRLRRDRAGQPLAHRPGQGTRRRARVPRRRARPRHTRAAPGGRARRQARPPLTLTSSRSGHPTAAAAV
jgi:hypothetical protein